MCPVLPEVAYAWIATVVVTIAVAARRGVPILHAFGPIRAYPGLYVSLALLAIASLLVSLQFLSDVQPFGQQPITLATLVALLYSWMTITYQLRNR